MTHSYQEGRRGQSSTRYVSDIKFVDKGEVITLIVKYGEMPIGINEVVIESNKRTGISKVSKCFYFTEEKKYKKVKPHQFQLMIDTLESKSQGKIYATIFMSEKVSSKNNIYSHIRGNFVAYKMEE